MVGLIPSAGKVRGIIVNDAQSFALTLTLRGSWIHKIMCLWPNMVVPEGVNVDAAIASVEGMSSVKEERRSGLSSTRKTFAITWFIDLNG